MFGAAWLVCWALLDLAELGQGTKAHVWFSCLITSGTARARFASLTWESPIRFARPGKLLVARADAAGRGEGKLLPNQAAPNGERFGAERTPIEADSEYIRTELS